MFMVLLYGKAIATVSTETICKQLMRDEPLSPKRFTIQVTWWTVLSSLILFQCTVTSKKITNILTLKYFDAYWQNKLW